MTEPASDENGGQPPLSPQDKRARVGATAAAIAIAAVVTSIVLGIGIAALLATAGGGDATTEERAAPTAGDSSATAGATTPLTTPVPPVVSPPASASPSAPPTTTPPALGTAGQVNKEAKQAPPKIEVAAGECLSGFGEKEVTEAPCGSPESRYKVSAVGPVGTACPADGDTSHTIADTTLCLDIDWVVGSCMDVSGDHPQPADCGPGGVQVISILPDTNSVNACPSADSGFVYDQRRFVVCFAEL
ncbi:LppU/SCO3897 family protein [Nocardia carnea]|uniref:LppU/SCO3897 family protein n=1 Tax=Nocardia carnea TaxID=37328 RepID=UPI00245754A2|nr:hypothetical protein [Nocardia carnea]